MLLIIFGFVILVLVTPVSTFADHRYVSLGVPPELIGSDESLAQQNEIADKYGFTRVKNLTELQLLVCAGALEKVVPARENPAYYITVEKRFRYARLEVAKFLDDLSKKFFAEFSRPLKITEFVRTEQYQKLLVRRGKTQADGRMPQRRSSHLTGSAFDISRKPLTSSEIKWLRDELVYWEAEDRIEATEEIYSNVFHVMVFPSYSGPDVIVLADSEMIKNSGCKTPKPVVKKFASKKQRSKNKPDN